MRTIVWQHRSIVFRSSHWRCNLDKTVWTHLLLIMRFFTSPMLSIAKPSVWKDRKRVRAGLYSREINTSSRIFGRRSIMSTGRICTVVSWDRLDTGQGQTPIDWLIANHHDSIIPLMAWFLLVRFFTAYCVMFCLSLYLFLSDKLVWLSWRSTKRICQFSPNSVYV